MPKISGKSPATFMLAERGVAHLLLMLVLLAGLVFAVYLVQQKTNIFSRASSGPISGPLGAPATLGVWPNNLAAGGSTTITWSKVSRPTVKDWVSLNRSDGQREGWFFTSSCTQTSGSEAKREASCNYTLPLPLQPGEYELRLLADNSNNILLAKTNLTVTAPSLGPNGTTVSVSPSAVTPSGNVTVSWDRLGTGTPKDWIALYRQGDQDRGYRNWLFIGTCSRTAGNTPSSTGSCTLQVPANTGNGTYEIRLFANNGYGRLAVSSPFTVGLAPTSAPVPSATIISITPTPTNVSVKRVFVTSTTYNGNLQSGSFNQCNERARAASLSGEWRAWLGGGSSGANVGWELLREGVEYRLINGNKIAFGRAQMLSGALAFPINITEFGTRSSAIYAWSFLKYDGYPLTGTSTDHCQNWTATTGRGRVGRPTAVDSTWTNANISTLCSNSEPIYCFEQ